MYNNVPANKTTAAAINKYDVSLPVAIEFSLITSALPDPSGKFANCVNPLIPKAIEIANANIAANPCFKM
ncbi:hypothetical protein ACFL3T_03685 [Patescibacteria group bacterium]